MENYAGVKDCDNAVKQELIEAGIEVLSLEFLREKGEVPTAIAGKLSPWYFERAWSYWIAKGPGMPPEEANALYASHGKVVRVGGHCGCPSPKELYHGFGVDCYHVDTQEGLNALATTIKNILNSK